MFDEIKKIKIEEVDQEREELQYQYARMFDEVNNSYVKYCDAQAEYQKLKEKKFTLIERLFTKRKLYQKLKTMPEKLAKFYYQYRNAEKETDQILAKTGIAQRVSAKEQELKMIKAAGTFEELGLTPVEAMVKLVDHDCDVIINEGVDVKAITDENYQTENLVTSERTPKLSHVTIGNSARTAIDDYEHQPL